MLIGLLPFGMHKQKRPAIKATDQKHLLRLHTF